MFERVIGSPVRDCCHALDTAEFRSKVKTLPLTLTPATVARLDHAATEFLHHHNVYDEPLRWQPNSGLFSACGLRSPTGDLTTILRLLDDGRTAMTDIAVQAGVPLEYLHYLIGEFDPSRARQRSTLDSDVRPSGMAAISRAELIELYEGQQLGLAAHRPDLRRLTPHRDAPGPPLRCGAAPTWPPLPCVKPGGGLPAHARLGR